jgi:hypothetical protein
MLFLIYTLFSHYNTCLHYPLLDYGSQLSHTDHQMALPYDVMTSGHPCIPSTFPLSLTYYPLIAPNYHVTLLPPMIVLEERNSLVCAV